MSNINTIFRITAIVFVVEIAIMFFIFVAPHSLQMFGASNFWFWPLVDTVFLVLLTSPLIYLWAIRPFTLARDAAEADLRQYKTTLDLLQDKIHISCPDTLKFGYMNKSARRDLGWSEAQYRTKTLNDIGDYFNEMQYRKSIEPLVKGALPAITFEAINRNQESIEITRQFIDAEGEQPRIVSIIRDISERKEAEKAKSEFVSTVSHELRTPLTSIKGALGLTRTDAIRNDPDKLERLLDMAATNADRLGFLVDDILDVEKLSSGMIELRSDTVNLSRLVNEAVEANEGYATKLGVFFNTTGVDLPVMVSGDNNRLMQVMANLMSNAAKFSPIGGQIEVLLSLNGSSARVSVRDHGSGIPDAAKDSIFERFTQVDSSDQRKIGGTGLGLSITKVIVERHQGTIGFISEVGTGSTFFFELPLKLAEQESPDVVEQEFKETRYANSKGIG